MTNTKNILMNIILHCLKKSVTNKTAIFIDDDNCAQ